MNADGGLDSGFHLISGKPRVSNFVAFDVKDCLSRWFFCAQTVPEDHCAAGIVFGLNLGDW